ncbi:hypothetical protein [Olleya sp. Bg11-27]|uniref:hypothetical protein n=1 Tax=Olleya sp. Bg11-27 TaxID=2058135 RepID=UPI000C30C969|nr:hypothetical protein [Olleya sp. Bg11-27]AUC77558.1 hypothetical protein CW732_18485 [Olleya sp. Bg11-27]
MGLLKLKAGALQLTLFIAVVIALLLAGFILLVHTHKRFSLQSDFIIQTAQNTTRGIRQALINQMPLNDTISIDLEEDYKTLKVQREFWGVFEKVTSIATIKKHTLKRVALIGGAQSKNNRTALYVQDNNKPLVLVGNTKIEGVVYLPERGVKSGNISGEYYYGSQLIYGVIRKASILPSLHKQTISQLSFIEKQMNKIKTSNFITLENGKTFSNSFLNKKQMAFSNSAIKLSNINLVGNIIIQSKIKITVASSSSLKDVILIAPEIEIEDDVKGAFQVIASKNISVGKKVYLEYPSALVLNEEEIQQSHNAAESVKQNKVFIDERSTIKGVVLYISESKANNYNSQIEIKEKTTIIGEVYCSKNLELNGAVYGSVFTNNFIANQFGSIYQNHIYNGKIIVDSLPQEYVGLSFNNSKKGVLKWLY